jgi:hypothetical protein
MVALLEGSWWFQTSSIKEWWMSLSSWGTPILQTFFLVPFPRSVPRHNPVSELYGQFLQPHDLDFALTCALNCGTFYRQVCTFPYHVQSINITAGGLQSSCRNTSRMINGNRMHLSKISSLIAKSLNTYINKVFQLFILFFTFAKMSTFFVIMGCCV